MNAIHRRPLELAAAAVDFELSPAERAELAGHLRDCAACRGRVEGIRRDAAAIGALPVLAVAPGQAARLRAATVARPRRSGMGTLRLVAVAAILALLLLGVLAVGASLLDRRPFDLAVVPLPSPSGPAAASPSAVVPSPDSTPAESPVTEPVAYEPPAPICPAPPDAVPAPVVTVSVGGANPVPSVTAAELVVTCSTANPSDFGEVEPETPAPIRAGDPLQFTVEAGWEILHWEGFDRPRAGEGANVIPGETPTDGPSSITVAAPARTGDVILGVTLWARTTDGRVIASLSSVMWLQVGSVAAPALRIVPHAGCDAIAWPEGVPTYRTVTFRISAEAEDFATAVSDTGAQIETEWPEGFAIGSASDGTIVDGDGTVVARDGEVLLIEEASATVLHGYPICLTPGHLAVLSQSPGG